MAGFLTNLVPTTGFVKIAFIISVVRAFLYDPALTYMEPSARRGWPSHPLARSAWRCVQAAAG